MKGITAAVAAIVVVILLVAALNWNLVIAKVPVDLYVTTIDAPLALLLLIGLVLVAILYFATLGTIRMQAAMESRELHRELDRARRLAESAEGSRLADLRAYLDRELPQIELKLDQALERLDVRVPSAMPGVAPVVPPVVVR